MDLRSKKSSTLTKIYIHAFLRWCWARPAGYRMSASKRILPGYLHRILGGWQDLDNCGLNNDREVLTTCTENSLGTRIFFEQVTVLQVFRRRRCTPFDAKFIEISMFCDIYRNFAINIAKSACLR